MHVTVTTDIADLLASLSDVARKQVPYASAVALTRIAERTRYAERQAISSRLDSPTRYTQNGINLKSAKKGDWPAQSSQVWIKDKSGKDTAQQDYLTTQVHGGIREHKRHERRLIAKGLMASNQHALPSKSLPRNGYGNISTGVYVKVLSGLKAFSGRSSRINRSTRPARYFVAEINGTKGVWERKRTSFGDGASLVFGFVNASHNYRKRYPFFKVAENKVKAHYATEFSVALSDALKTAK